MRGADGTTYIPFSLTLDAPSSRRRGGLYVRVVSKGAAAAPAPAPANNTQERRAGLPVGQRAVPRCEAGRQGVSRHGAQAGEYEVSSRSRRRARSRPSATSLRRKMGASRRDLTVPEFAAPDLTTSSVLLGAIEQLSAPLTPEQQQENPYTFGNMRVVPSPDAKFKKSGELQVLFWVYGDAGERRQAGSADRVQLSPEDGGRREVLQQDRAAAVERVDAAGAVRCRRWASVAGQPGRAAREFSCRRLSPRDQADRQDLGQDADSERQLHRRGVIAGEDLLP